MTHSTDSTTDVYMIGFGSHLRTAIRSVRFRIVPFREAARRLVREVRAHGHRRNYWGFWQAEWPECSRAQRGLTEASTRRKADRIRTRLGQ